VITRASGEFGPKKPPRFMSFRDRAKTESSDQPKKTALRHTSLGHDLREVYNGPAASPDGPRSEWETPADVGNWSRRRTTDRLDLADADRFSFASSHKSREEVLCELEGDGPS